MKKHKMKKSDEFSIHQMNEWMSKSSRKFGAHSTDECGFQADEIWCPNFCQMKLFPNDIFLILLLSWLALKSCEDLLNLFES